MKYAIIKSGHQADTKVYYVDCINVANRLASSLTAETGVTWGVWENRKVNEGEPEYLRGNDWSNPLPRLN